MRRTLRIAVALSAFALGLTLAGAGRQLPYALPAVVLVGLALSALRKRVRLPALDGHRLKVAALTLVLWVPLPFVFALLLSPSPTGCIVYSAHVPDYPLPAKVEACPVFSATPPPPPFEWGGAENCREDAVVPVAADAKVIWGGVIDRKVLSKPKASAPPEALAPGVKWTVAVAVVVDGVTGRVVVARPLSGTSDLRRAAARAACDARPTSPA